VRLCGGPAVARTDAIRQVVTRSRLNACTLRSLARWRSSRDRWRYHLGHLTDRPGAAIADQPQLAAMTGWLKRRRRRKLLAAPFPPAWDRIIDDNVVLARDLDPARRQRLRERVTVFVAETWWEGCGGLELTEEVQVTIAAQACLLTLDRDDDQFTEVSSILVYPSTHVTPPRPLGLFEQPRAPVGHGRAVIGLAMHRGPVTLAWDAVLAGGRGEAHGNVVLHELAHKLDMANGVVDGTPPLPSQAARDRWNRVFTRAYDEHRARVAAGWPTLLDPYAATDEAEMFAVTTEAYFTRPAELALEHPEVLALLADFYRGRALA